MIKKIVIFLVTLIVLLGLHNCVENPVVSDSKAVTKTNDVEEETLPSKQPIATPIANQQNLATAAINAFATKLYAQLSQQSGNLFLSPYSVSTALTMIYAGAKGETKLQMARALQFNTNQHIQHGFRELQKSFNNEDSSYQLSIANGIWVQKRMTLFAEFMETLYDFYGIVARTADFENATEIARRSINAVIAKQTHGKIQDLLMPSLLSPETRLVLTNAIYFKGKWQNPFLPEETQDMIFIKSDNSQIEVPTMYQKGEFGLWENEDVQLIELPYQTSQKNAELSMVILLPRKHENFAVVEQQLSDYLQKNSHDPSEVAVYLPKFKTESAFSLQEPLQTLGMTDAFDSTKANLSGITEENIIISAVEHKAFIEVNEEGTEAAAATTVIASRGRATVFRANHPFIFWIKDNQSGTILFLGRLMNPTF
ncbi:Proteinase inhibitor I4, serpin [Beggiatoa sp. PS]|nr:Proteinase inhibitor I4, serpin [Beggiatoa sp. PS]